MVVWGLEEEEPREKATSILYMMHKGNKQD
uniref:Uncharacterized protein n=1 Tax=Rhizophora mucronata TaxID=61149 RepID=A0A2P2QCE9_RHIMU